MDYPIVEIIWYDSMQTRGWQNKEDILEGNDISIHTVCTVGYKIKETDEWIVVCDSVSEHQFNNPFAILKKSIISLKTKS